MDKPQLHNFIVAMTTQILTAGELAVKFQGTVTNIKKTIATNENESQLEYVRGKDNYSINVGLISEGRMLTALIYFPAWKKIYYLAEDGQPYEASYNLQLQLEKTRLLTAVQLTSNILYVNNRVPDTTIATLKKVSNEVITDNGSVIWPEALLKCISGAFTAALFHTPQVRDVLLGALIEKLPNGYMTDWEGQPIAWPNGGRIPRVVFGTGKLSSAFFASLKTSIIVA